MNVRRFYVAGGQTVRDPDAPPPPHVIVCPSLLTTFGHSVGDAFPVPTSLTGVSLTKHHITISTTLALELALLPDQTATEKTLNWTEKHM